MIDVFTPRLVVYFITNGGTALKNISTLSGCLGQKTIDMTVCVKENASSIM